MAKYNNPNQTEIKMKTPNTVKVGIVYYSKNHNAFLLKKNPDGSTSLPISDLKSGGIQGTAKQFLDDKQIGIGQISEPMHVLTHQDKNRSKTLQFIGFVTDWDARKPLPEAEGYAWFTFNGAKSRRDRAAMFFLVEMHRENSYFPPYIVENK